VLSSHLVNIEDSRRTFAIERFPSKSDDDLVSLFPLAWLLYWMALEINNNLEKTMAAPTDGVVRFVGVK
jgi:hypothetical protein